jgi:hypothetical protein
MLEVFKNPKGFVGTTGLVFAGFGDHDVFPAMIAYRSYGMIAGKHVSQEDSRMAVDHQNPAWLSAFAQTSMSDTFSLGLSEDVYSSVMQALTEGLAAFAEDICRESGGNREQIPDLRGLVAGAQKESAMPS